MVDILASSQELQPVNYYINNPHARMKIISGQSVGLMVDIQEKLVPHMHKYQVLIKNTEKLIRGLKILDVPLITTQQYTKGLGPTIDVIEQYLSGINKIEKLTFSCCGEENFMHELNRHNRKFIIIAGIEAHVCVLQTTADLIASGYYPVIVKDCISSRKPEDKKSAIARMRDEGAVITTFESILFELCQVAGTDRFKEISKIVK